MFGKLVSAAKRVANFCKPAVEVVKHGAKRLAAVVVTAAVAVGASSTAFAVDADATEALTAASTAITTLKSIVVGLVTFFTVVKVVKWVRK